MQITWGSALQVEFVSRSLAAEVLLGKLWVGLSMCKGESTMSALNWQSHSASIVTSRYRSSPSCASVNHSAQSPTPSTMQTHSSNPSVPNDIYHSTQARRRDLLTSSVEGDGDMFAHVLPQQEAIPSEKGNSVEGNGNEVAASEQGRRLSLCWSHPSPSLLVFALTVLLQSVHTLWQLLFVAHLDRHNSPIHSLIRVFALPLFKSPTLIWKSSFLFISQSLICQSERCKTSKFGQLGSKPVMRALILIALCVATHVEAATSQDSSTLGVGKASFHLLDNEARLLEAAGELETEEEVTQAPIVEVGSHLMRLLRHKLKVQFASLSVTN